MYLYCICYIALVILAGLTVFRHRWNGTQILFSPFNVDRTLSLRGILVLLIVLHHLSGVTSFRAYRRLFVCLSVSLPFSEEGPYPCSFS